MRAEIPRPTLEDLLELTTLIAIKDPGRFSRVAARWLLRYLEAVEDATRGVVFLDIQRSDLDAWVAAALVVPSIHDI